MTTKDVTTSINRISFTKRDVIIVFRDGGSYEQELMFESGVLTWTEVTETISFTDRHGDLVTRDGSDHPMELSFDFVRAYVNSSHCTIHGWLTCPKGSWEAENLISSLGVGRDFRINVDVTILGDKCGGVDDVTVRFYHWKPRVSTLERNFFTGSVSGTCMSTRPVRL